MYLDCYGEVKQITKELVSVPSIVRDPGAETNCAKKIHEYYKGLNYFKQYPDRTKMIKTEDDFMDRHSTYAYVKGTKGDSNKTILLIDHIDTVGIDDFGTIREYAFKPDELPQKLLELDLDDEVRADLESGEYMFGRGALDMKSGIAGHMYLIKYFSEHPEELNGNILAYSECDEEDNSHGIMTGLKEFKRLKEKEGFQYIACINADYSTGYNLADINRYIYFGSIGKLLPSFYVLGKETHVGHAYGGLDPNLILAEINRLMELNTDLCDEAQGEITIPPISLKQADFKEGYTVQTALAAYSYYNFFTLSMSPEDVIGVSRQKAVEAFDNAIIHMNESYRRYCEKRGVEYNPLPWESRVYTWQEYYDMLFEKHGKNFANHINSFAERLNQEQPALDLRLFSIKVIEEACTWDKDKSPMIIVFFGSIFSARIEMTGKTEKENTLLSAVDNAIKTVQQKCENPIKIRMFYPYISDSSFMALSDDVKTLEALGKNMPSWKTKYYYDSDLVLAINVPVVNIGSFGKDGHMVTERVHMKYTFENVPNMTYLTILECLK